MDNKKLNELLSEIVTFIDKRFKWEKIYGLENLEFKPNKIMSLSILIKNNKAITDIYPKLQNENDEYLWGQLSEKVFHYIDSQFKEKPEQFLFEIDSAYNFNVDFKYDVFNKNISFTQEELFWQYKKFGLVPNSEFFKNELNKSLKYHNQKTVSTENTY